MDAQGNHIGYMAEQEKGMANAVARQSFGTHRSFVTHVFDRQENEVLRVSLTLPVESACGFCFDHPSSIDRSPGSTPEFKCTILSMSRRAHTPPRPLYKM